MQQMEGWLVVPGIDATLPVWTATYKEVLE